MTDKVTVPFDAASLRRRLGAMRPNLTRKVA
jgi:hypothetical protein